jgi:hypothetical protein
VETRRAHRYLWTSALCFSTVLKLVQALVIIYSEIFQVLVVGGDILLLKPFLEPTPPTVQPQLSPFGLSRLVNEETSLRTVISI